MNDDPLDCLIIGGGPAGLTAAIYLARFHLKLQVVDAGNSRAALDPLHPQSCRLSRRHIGEELLARMTAQAQKYGAAIETGPGDPARPDRRRLRAPNGAQGAATARTVLLATGVTQPPPADGRGAARRGAGRAA